MTRNEKIMIHMTCVRSIKVFKGIGTELLIFQF